jgi:hypothetical protein
VRLPIPLAGNHGIARSTIESNQITLNLYAEVTKDGKVPVPLYRCPGLKTSVDLGGLQRSNGALFDGKIFFVVGSKLKSIDSNEAITEVGTINSTSGRVSIIEGQTYLMLVDGQNGYAYDGTTLSAITDVDFPAEQTPPLEVNHVTYKDGFFCVVAKDTGDYYVSAAEDPTSWEGLDFENAEGRPDLLKTIHASDDFLYLFGEYSTEAHYNAGDPVFPFRRAQGGVSSWGVHAEWSLAEGDNAVFYLGQIREGGIAVCKTMGARVEVISTPEIADEINKLGTTSDAFGFCYMQRSHHFYVLTFPQSKKTFTFDITTGLWATRGTKDLGRWRPNGHGYFNNKHYVGDILGGQFYTLDLETYTDGDDWLECKRITAPIHKDYRPMTFHELILDLEGGVGGSDLNPEPDFVEWTEDEVMEWTLDDYMEWQTQERSVDNNPAIMMRYSDDGGKTWSSELVAQIGNIGNYKYKAVWYQLGESYERIFEFRTTDSYFTAWLTCYADISLGAY